MYKIQKANKFLKKTYKNMCPLVACVYRLIRIQFGKKVVQILRQNISIVVGSEIE
jgi:hypothetical protein